MYNIIKDKGTEKEKAHGLHRPNGERENEKVFYQAKQTFLRWLS